MISNSGGMKTFVEVRNLVVPKDTKYIRISTCYDGAKDPNSERTRLDMCLTDEEYNILKDLINEMHNMPE